MVTTLCEIIWSRPHAGGPRQVQRGQLIHESVFENIKKTQIMPKALLYDSLSWNDAEELRNMELIEQDIYSNASTLMNKLREKNEVSEADFNTLLTLIASGKWTLIGVDVCNSNWFNRPQTLLQILDYERKKGDGKENEQDGLSGIIELLLSALAECNPTDEDKLSFLESDLQRVVGRRRGSDSSLHAMALKLLNKFAGERQTTVMTIFCD
jgi:hypothetical protein